MNPKPFNPQVKEFSRSDRWPNLNLNDILIACRDDDDNLCEAIIELATFRNKITPKLCIYRESFAILPLLAFALSTLPEYTTEDDICAALEAVGFRDATGDK
jgi:hypothetical protein